MTNMHVTDKEDGIHILNHGVLSVSDMVDGYVKLDPSKLGPALAKINRYAGNTVVPWNDAEHSILVAQLVPEVVNLVDVEELFLKRPTVVDTVKLWKFLMEGDERHTTQVFAMAHMWGLLHDVVECVVGDTPNPVKKYEEHMGGSGGAAENILTQRLKIQQLGDYAYVLARKFTGLEQGVGVDATAGAILELLQDFVKPADKLALLIEMRYMHNTSVLDYVERLWQINPQTQAFVQQFQWERLRNQVAFETLDWRCSARCWGEFLQGARLILRKAFA